MNLMLVLLNIGLLVGLVFLVHKKTKKTWINPFWIPFVVLKVIGGALVFALYQYHYGMGDLLGYLNDAAVYRILGLVDFAVAIFKSGVSEDIVGLLNYVHEPRAIFMAKIVAIFHYLAGNNWLTSANISVVSAIAIFYFCFVLGQHFSSYRSAVLIGFMFFPSTLFWGSGILKEAIVYPSILLVLLPLIGTIFQLSLHKWNYLFATIGLFLVIKIKYYVAAVLFPIMLAAWLTYILSTRTTIPKFVLWLGILLLPAMLASQLHPNLYPSRVAKVIAENHQQIVAVSNEQSLIYFANVESTMISILKNFPKAAFSGVFRPILGERNALPHMVLGVENILLLLTSILLLFFLLLSGKWKDLPFWVIPTLAYLGILAGLLCLSTPNFGTMARYKILYMPLLIFLIALGFQWLKNDRIKSPKSEH